MTKVRWQVAWFMFVMTAINYVDRANISIAAPFIGKEFHLNPAVMGIVLSAFSWTYTAFQLPAGAFVDKVGGRISYIISGFWWAIISSATALVNSVGALIGIRLLLGIGEAPSFPTSTRILAEWIPTKERGRANSMFDAGIPFGSAIAPPLLAVAIVRFGWQGAFVVSGILSLLVAVIWTLWYKEPANNPKISEEERRLIPAGHADGQTRPRVRWAEIFRIRNAWGLTIGNFFMVYVLFMFLTWLPGYLYQARHMTIIKTGFYASIPWLCATVVALLAGVMTDRLIHMGWSPLKARKIAMVTGMIAAVAVLPAAFVTSQVLAIALISVSVSGLMFANSQAWAAVEDATPVERVATVGALVNFGGNIGGLLAPVVTGWLVYVTHSFVIPLSIGGVLALIGSLCWGLIVKDDSASAAVE